MFSVQQFVQRCCSHVAALRDFQHFFYPTTTLKKRLCRYTQSKKNNEITRQLRHENTGARPMQAQIYYYL